MLSSTAGLVAVLAFLCVATQPASAAPPAAGAAAITDGCSRSFDFPGGYGFKRYCNFHDRCYAAFHFFKRSWKDRCDKAFYKGLYHKACAKVYDRTKCRQLAWAYYRGVRTYFGTQAYLDAQSRGSAGNRPGYA